MRFFHTATSKRLVAVLLISLTCLCIFEDLLTRNSCGEDGTPPLPQSRALALSKTASSQQPSSTDSSDRDHDCFCCCRHVLLVGFFQSVHVVNVSFIDSTPLKAIPSVDLLPAYHPPRA
jgi:hypothetical protein